MGCSPSAEKPVNSLRLALFGISGTGKSTFYKQLRICHTDGFSSGEVVLARTTMATNVVFGVRDLCVALKENKIKLNKKVTQAIKDIEKIADIVEISTANNSIYEVKEKIWKDAAVQKFLRNPKLVGWSEYEETIKYAMENWTRISDPDWIPTNEDILHIRVRTSGLVETSVMVDKYQWNIIDAGGQRVERRKWPNAMQNLNGVLYWVALSDYDQPSEMVDMKTKMHESLSIFEDLAFSNDMATSSLILFLNKKDLFKERVSQVPIEDYWPRFKPQNADIFTEGVKFFHKRFQDIVLKEGSKVHPEAFYVHVTCALDTEQMRFVFASTRDFVFKQRMTFSGL